MARIKCVNVFHPLKIIFSIDGIWTYKRTWRPSLAANVCLKIFVLLNLRPSVYMDDHECDMNGGTKWPDLASSLAWPPCIRLVGVSPPPLNDSFQTPTDHHHHKPVEIQEMSLNINCGVHFEWHFNVPAL